jgi:indolepyruvate ferredoxin oxidoreductase
LGLLAKAKVLRGTIWDPFGYSQERRMERHLIDAHIQLVQELLPLVNTKNKELMRDIMALPLSMRGFGHVKARNVRAAQSRQAWLLHRIDPTRYPRPQDDNGLQQLRGVAIRSI